MVRRDLDCLHPIVATKISRLIDEAWRQYKIEMLILATNRDDEGQAEAYSIGRTQIGASAMATRPMGQVATDNAPGWSFHQFGLEADLWPIYRGQVIPGLVQPYLRLVWTPLNKLARHPAINLRSGYYERLSTGNRRLGHFRWSAGHKVEYFRNGFRVPDVRI
jgi:hypothetical protein